MFWRDSRIMGKRYNGRRSRWDEGDPDLIRVWDPLRGRRVEVHDDHNGYPVARAQSSSRGRYNTRSQNHRYPPSGPSSLSFAERVALPHDPKGKGVARSPSPTQSDLTYRDEADEIIALALRRSKPLIDQAAGASSSAGAAILSPSYSPEVNDHCLPCAYCVETRELHAEMNARLNAFTLAVWDKVAELVAARNRTAEYHCPGHIDADGMVGMDWQYEDTTLVCYAERRPSYMLRQALAMGISSGTSRDCQPNLSFSSGVETNLPSEAETTDRSLEGLIAASIAGPQAVPRTTPGINPFAPTSNEQLGGVVADRLSETESIT